jgi:uncharacterized membrane protein HdeD (DUF308 family)
MNNNKNKLDFLLLIAVFVLSMAFTYLLVSFTLWDLNASHWPMGARVLYAIFGTGFSAITTSAVDLYSK